MILAFYFLFNTYFLYIQMPCNQQTFSYNNLHTRTFCIVFNILYSACIIIIITIYIQVVSCELMFVHTCEWDSSPGFDGVTIKFYYFCIFFSLFLLPMHITSTVNTVPYLQCTTMGPLKFGRTCDRTTCTKLSMTSVVSGTTKSFHMVKWNCLIIRLIWPCIHAEMLLVTTCTTRGRKCYQLKAVPRSACTPTAGSLKIVDFTI